MVRLYLIFSNRIIKEKMKKIVALICMLALMVAPMGAFAAEEVKAPEKKISVEAYKAGDAKKLSMANDAISHDAVVVEKDGKYVYTLKVKPMDMKGMKGSVTNLFVYVDNKKVEAKKTEIKGDFNTQFEFTAPKSDEIKAAIWVDVMDKLQGGKPGAGEQEVLLKFGWEDKKETGKMVTQPSGTDALQVFVNGNQIKFDVKPYAENNRTLVPMRAIFEALGAKVEWDQKEQMATAKKDGVTIKLVLGKAEGTIEKADGNKEVKKLDVASKAKDGRTFVPLRFIGEAFGNTVDFKIVKGFGLINITDPQPAK